MFDLSCSTCPWPPWSPALVSLHRLADLHRPGSLGGPACSVLGASRRTRRTPDSAWGGGHVHDPGAAWRM